MDEATPTRFRGSKEPDPRFGGGAGRGGGCQGAGAASIGEERAAGRPRLVQISAAPRTVQLGTAGFCPTGHVVVQNFAIGQKLREGLGSMRQTENQRLTRFSDILFSKR